MSGENEGGECEIVEDDRRPPNHMSRHQVSVRLGCSVMQVVRFEKTGRLHSVRVERRVWFKAEEVVQLAGTWRRRRRTKRQALDAEKKGKLAAQCFALFAVGKQLVEIVMLLECSYELVHEFYEAYHTSLEDHRRLRSRERELAREARRQATHDRAQERRESREHRLREVALLAKAGLTKHPGHPGRAQSLAKIARDRLLMNGGIAPGPLPGESPPESDGQSR